MWRPRWRRRRGNSTRSTPVKRRKPSGAAQSARTVGQNPHPGSLPDPRGDRRHTEGRLPVRGPMANVPVDISGAALVRYPWRACHQLYGGLGLSQTRHAIICHLRRFPGDPSCFASTATACSAGWQEARREGHRDNCSGSFEPYD